MSDKDLINSTLTETEQRVVMSYLLDFNINETSRRVGLGASTVRRWIGKPHMQQAVDVYKAKSAERCDITRDQVLNELKRMAFYDVKDHIQQVTDSGVTFKDFEEMDGRAISEITMQTTSDGLIFTNIKVHSKLKALEILANFMKSAPDEKHVHFHIDDEDLKNKSAADCAQAYVDLLNQ